VCQFIAGFQSNGPSLSWRRCAQNATWKRLTSKLSLQSRSWNEKPSEEHIHAGL
jgi:hypothetical protein